MGEFTLRTIPDPSEDQSRLNEGGVTSVSNPDREPEGSQFTLFPESDQILRFDLRKGKYIEVLKRIIDQLAGEVLSIHKILTHADGEAFKKNPSGRNPGVGHRKDGRGG